MEIQHGTPDELASALKECADAALTISLGGNFSKDRMGGPKAAADVTISTRSLDRVLIFEPRDLTISVEAGMAWSALTHLLDRHQMMIPLDPPCAELATVGGVIATNSSGSRRRGYGTARDLVIGMKFATLEGKTIQSGGMVVKNVAGLDMAKLMIGSFGTLAAIASVNFKLIPKPPESRTFVVHARSLDEAVEARNRILRGVLQPVALDLMNPQATAIAGLEEGWSLLVRVAGTAVVMNRYAAELPEAVSLEESVWDRVRDFAPSWQGAVVRFSCTLNGIADAFRVWKGPMLAHAGNGICYGFAREDAKVPDGFRGLVEWGGSANAWSDPGSDFAVMQRIKQMMDPQHLLNRGRLYGRI